MTTYNLVLGVMAANTSRKYALHSAQHGTLHIFFTKSYTIYPVAAAVQFLHTSHF